VISDRIEAGTFLCAVAATGGDITIRNTRVDSWMRRWTSCARSAPLTIGDDWIRAQMDKRPHAVTFRTTEYPGFPTDMQAQFMAVNTIAEGASRVTETIFENRFMHVQEMNRLGAQLKPMATPPSSRACSCPAPRDGDRPARIGFAGDRRPGCRGETLIDRIYHLDRGYDRWKSSCRPSAPTSAHQQAKPESARPS
jgi:UDP-N-acetylglucosamine 1-carboxyvinyltransferase